jgi:hypothetical protein
MAADHSSYEELAQQRRGSEEYREGHAEARRAFLIGHAVRERRLELGLSRVAMHPSETALARAGAVSAVSGNGFEVWHHGRPAGFAKFLPADYLHADGVNLLAPQISVRERDPDYANAEESEYA